MSVATDQIRTIRESQLLTFTGTAENLGEEPLILASGYLSEFRACFGRVAIDERNQVRVDPESAQLLKLKAGDTIVAMGR